MLATHSAGSSAAMNFNNAMLVVEGICVIRRKNYLVVAVRPGDLIMPPRIANDSPISFSGLFEEPEDVAAETRVDFLTNTTCAIFRQKSIERLLEHSDDINLLKALFDNLRDLSSHLTAYRLALSHPAYKAVLYVLRFCKYYGFNNLTHQQLAMLTNLNRSTVTEVMHKIAISNPEIL